MEDIQEDKIQLIGEVNQYLLIDFLTVTAPDFTDSLFFLFLKEKQRAECRPF